MWKFWIGTAVLIGGVSVIVILATAGVPLKAAKYIGMAVSVVGFGIQMYTAFSIKFKFERERRLARQRHEELLRTAASLPPEEAIQLLLREPLSKS